MMLEKLRSNKSENRLLTPEYIGIALILAAFYVNAAALLSG